MCIVVIYYQSVHWRQKLFINEMWLEFLFIIYMLSLLNSENGKLNKKTKFILSVGHSLTFHIVFITKIIITTQWTTFYSTSYFESFHIYPLLLGWQMTKSNPCKPCSENIYNCRNYTNKYFWEYPRILEITQTAGIK